MKSASRSAKSKPEKTKVKAKTKVKERLLNQSEDLFYFQGYYKTGVREIVKEAGAAVQSFYDHFGSKEQLGYVYLRQKQAEMRSNMQELMDLYDDPRKFLRAWVIKKKKEIRDGDFIGCPFAGFAYQSADLEPAHQELLNEISDDWDRFLEGYLGRAQENGYISKKADPSEVTRRVLVLYQGSVAMWRLSGDESYIKHMEDGILAEINRWHTK